jgi:fructokinase
MTQARIGIDFGGTKLEIAVLAADGSELLRRRRPTPATYQATLAALIDMVRQVEQEMGQTLTVGIGIPGIISPKTGLVKNSSTISLNGQRFDQDISTALGRPVRVDNDANCFALSEAIDGAGAGHSVVFGVIIGTGCGGGIVHNGTVWRGRHGIAGEWGHTPLPWPSLSELPGPHCWCGQFGCLETMISGTGLARDCDGADARDASGLPVRAQAGDRAAQAALDRHLSRLARGLAQIVNILDPDCIVLGGGLSNMAHLYQQLPVLLRRYAFNDFTETPVVKNQHGDSSGVRGAARLWPLP